MSRDFILLETRPAVSETKQAAQMSTVSSWVEFAVGPGPRLR